MVQDDECLVNQHFFEIMSEWYFSFCFLLFITLSDDAPYFSQEPFESPFHVSVMNMLSKVICFTILILGSF